MGKVTGLLATVAAVWAPYRRWLRPWMYTWGASTEEARAVLPGDELVKGNVPCTTRAVTVDAPVDAVWPWLAQIGEDRAGFYSYDALERAVGAHMHNAERVHPEWQRLNPGDTVWLARRFGRQASQTVAVVAPGSHLVLMSPDDHAAVRAGGSARGTWSFYLFPDADRTRLVARGRGGWAGIPVFDVAHFIMERKMLLGLADRAAAALQSRPSSPASDSMAATTAAGSPEAPDTGSAARV